MSSTGGNFHCPESGCTRSFGSAQSLHQHLNAVQHGMRCGQCPQRFASILVLREHEEKSHSTNVDKDDDDDDDRDPRRLHQHQPPSTLMNNGTGNGTIARPVPASRRSSRQVQPQQDGGGRKSHNFQQPNLPSRSAGRRNRNNSLNNTNNNNNNGNGNDDDDDDNNDDSATDYKSRNSNISTVEGQYQRGESAGQGGSGQQQRGGGFDRGGTCTDNNMNPQQQASSSTEPENPPLTLDDIKRRLFGQLYFDGVSSPKSQEIADEISPVFLELSKHITKSTTDRLIVGNVQRHTTLQPHGMRGRDEVMNKLGNALLGFKCGTKERTPFIGLTSMPRQGKTLFLDTAANSEEVAKALRGDPSKTFIFNITFNAAWAVPTKSVNNLAQARAAIFIRLFAAAANLSHCDIDDYEELVKALAEKLSVGGFVNVLVPVISKVRGVDKEYATIFLFDEFTNLTDQLEDDDVRNKVYSEIASLIGTHSAVICSGFTQVPDYDKSPSGRSLEHLELNTIGDAETRRQMLVMKTRFFQQRAVTTNNNSTTVMSAALLYTYELVKSSPGVLGSIIENPSENGPDFGVTFLGQLLGAGTCTTVDGKKISIHFHTMRRTLEWKSIQFLNAVERGNARKVIARDLRDAESRRLVQLNAEYIDLSRVRLEPYFLAIMLKSDSPNVPTKDDDEFLFWKYLKMLESYCEASLVVGDARRQQRVAPIANSRFSGSDRVSSVPPANASSNLNQLNGSFLQEAVAVGLLAQRQHRHRLLAESKPELLTQLVADHGLSFALGDLLLDATFLLSSTGGCPRFSMEVPLPAPHDPFPDRIEVFDGDFPPFARNFDTSIIHVPNRLKENPRIAVICNEKLSAGCSSSPNDVAQFWFDLKHTETNPLTDISESGNNKPVDLDVLHQMIFESDDEFKLRETTTAGHMFASHVRSGLNNLLLHRLQGTSTVEHVVHVVVSPYRLPRPTTDASHVRTHVKIDLRWKIKSYSLFLVSPDSLAFENLISQPIARSIPLMDQQHVDAWATTVPEPRNWWQYKATTRELPESVKTSWDFNQWTNCLFLDDAAGTCLGNLFESKEEAVRVLNGCSLDKSGWDVTDLLTIPFGCFLECFGIIPLKRSPTGAPLHFSDEFSITIEQSDDQQQVLVVNVLGHKTELFCKQELVDAVRRNIRVGHICGGILFDRVNRNRVQKSLEVALIFWQTDIVTWTTDKNVRAKCERDWHGYFDSVDEQIRKLNLQ